MMIEVPFTASRTYADPFQDVTLDVVLTDPTNREFRVPAFWAGKNRWKARYAFDHYWALILEPRPQASPK